GVAAQGELLWRFPISEPREGRSVSLQEEGPPCAHGDVLLSIAGKVRHEEFEDFAEALVSPFEARLDALPVARLRAGMAGSSAPGAIVSAPSGTSASDIAARPTAPIRRWLRHLRRAGGEEEKDRQENSVHHSSPFGRATGPGKGR